MYLTLYLFFHIFVYFTIFVITYFYFVILHSCIVVTWNLEINVQSFNESNVKGIKICFTLIIKVEQKYIKSERLLQ